jgi:hypothetical protein
VTGLGPQSAAQYGVRPPTVARATSRGERAVERLLARADPAEPGERRRVDRVRLRFARQVAHRCHHRRRRLDRGGGGA